MKRLATIAFFSILGFAILSSEIAATIAAYVLGGLLLWLIAALVLDALIKEK